MVFINKNQFNPDYAVHPGEILEETLQARSISNRELASRSGLTEKHISQIIHGKSSVTPDTAILLERILDVKAELWLKLDSDYRLFIQKKHEKEAWGVKTEWAKKFPTKELMKRKFLPQTSDDLKIVDSLLSFFNIGTIEAWQRKYSEMEVQFRRSKAYTCSGESIAAWLAIGENIAKGVHTSPYDKAKFENALTSIRPLTKENPASFERQLVELCAAAGVVAVFVRELPGTHTSGAAYWLGKEKAIIMLSLRHKTDDHFWFTFYHEAGHILLHGNKGIIVDAEDLHGNEQDDEANTFAADFLVPRKEYDNFILSNPRIDEKLINQFAVRLGIAPGIVVGRLQKEGRLQFNWHNGLKRHFELKD
jgi:HTH-type transcriptional regulator / antitoxin HigA